MKCEFLKFDEFLTKVSMRLKYPIEDKESMEQYVKDNKTGLPLNQDLFDCYRNAEADALCIKEDPRFRVINYKKG